MLALLAGVFGGAASCAAPIQADMMGNAFLTALTNAGIAYDQPATTVALGRSVCPMVVAPGGTFESITSRMAEINGMSRDMASTFTIVAIGTYCLAVARAEGARLDDDVVDEVVRLVRSAPQDMGTSMLADRAAHRPLEWDLRNGVIVRKARAHGLATPISDVLVPLLAAASDGPG
ncbi:DUF732 domain-containing protein [Mycobacterium tuberculosis]|nr:DUF732 domain-containing protein [Mycobacterium tuberculosis]